MTSDGQFHDNPNPSACRSPLTNGDVAVVVACWPVPLVFPPRLHRPSRPTTMPPRTPRALASTSVLACYPASPFPASTGTSLRAGSRMPARTLPDGPPPTPSPPTAYKPAHFPLMDMNLSSLLTLAWPRSSSTRTMTRTYTGGQYSTRTSAGELILLWMAIALTPRF